MQACTPLDAAQRIPGVLPDERLLLHAAGEPAVRAVLPQIDAIEAQGIAPAAVSPAYWRSPRACHCRPTPPSGTPPGSPGGRYGDGRLHYLRRADWGSRPAPLTQLSKTWAIRSEK